MNKDSASSVSLIHRFQVSIQFCLSMASKCISKLTQSSPHSESQHSLHHGLQTLSITTSKFTHSCHPTWISKLAQSRPPSSHNHGLPSAPPNSLNHGLQVCMIMASNWISKLTQSWPGSASLSAHNRGLQTHSITASKFSHSRHLKWISILAQSLSPSSHDHGLPSVLPNSLNHGLQVCMIMASNWISKLAQSRPRSASLSSLNPGLQTHSITASKFAR